MADLDLNGTLFDSIATAKDAAAVLRKERAKANELAAQMQDRSVAMARELRDLADELDPPTEDTAVAWDGGATEHSATADDLDRWAQGREPLIPDVVNGKLHLRQAGRSWPAACEMCGAGNGQPCQAVSE